MSIKQAETLSTVQLFGAKLTKNAGKTRRADVLANRETIVEAARETFANKGLEASLDGIARAAGVGAGTLYRQFPARADLVAAGACQVVCVWARFIGICRSGRDRPRPFG